MVLPNLDAWRLKMLLNVWKKSVVEMQIWLPWTVEMYIKQVKFDSWRILLSVNHTYMCTRCCNHPAPAICMQYNFTLVKTYQEIWYSSVMTIEFARKKNTQPRDVLLCTFFCSNLVCFFGQYLYICTPPWESSVMNNVVANHPLHRCYPNFGLSHH